MKRRLITIVMSLILLFFIIGLVRSIYSLWSRGAIIGQRESIRQELATENEKLTKQLEHVESEKFIEKQAREKLNLQREGEVIVVLPQTLGEMQENEVEIKTAETPNWRQWLELFF